MKVAIIGSRDCTINNLEDYIPKECTEIVSGGAVGIDNCAAEFAYEKAMKLTEFLPQYEHYGKAAPIIRNKQIVEYADIIIAFWNGKSKGTLSVINYCKKLKKNCTIIDLS